MEKKKKNEKKNAQTPCGKFWWHYLGKSKSSATHSYQSVQHFPGSNNGIIYGCQCLPVFGDFYTDADDAHD